MVGKTVPNGTKPNYRVESRFYSPPAEFEGCFTTFYQLILDVEDGGTISDYLQPEWTNLRFFSGSAPDTHIGGTSVRDTHFTGTGPSSLPNRFSLGTTRMWGIGILPLGWSRYFSVAASDIANTVVDGRRHPAFSRFSPLAEVLCDDSASDQEQFDAIVDLMRQLARPSRDEQKILRIHRALVDAEVTTVSEFADSAGVSIRMLERLCSRYFGFPPKLLMRRQRFTRSLTAYLLLQEAKWTEVMDEHYHDQAQFTREFNTFMTMNPSEYAALEHPILSAFMEARARIWGSPAQALDTPG
jgi:AraC-like DNA-binding protein